MSHFRSRELGDRTVGEARSISSARVQAGHATTLPTEDRLKFADGRAVLGCTGRADLANAMRALRNTSRTARLPKGVAEGFLGQRLAALATDERKLAARPSRQRGSQCGQDRDGYADLPWLFSVRIVATPSRTCCRPN
jgi:hypothetical protein